MNTMKWLLRREFWEHKGAFFWAPVIIGAVLVTIIGGTVMYALVLHPLGTVSVNGHEVATAQMLSSMSPQVRSDIAGVMASTYIAFAGPLFAVLPVVVFFYCLAALYDDRRDRSILFWKSLPISDQMTVLSKVITALCVAPVITIAAGTAAGLLLLFIACAGLSLHGVNLFGAILSDPRFYLAPLHLLGLLPVYILWAIPTVGWLLLVSSWARSKVFLWAVGTPLLTLLLLRWMNFVLEQAGSGRIDLHWFAQNVVARGLLGLIPGMWLGGSDINRSALLRPDHAGVDLNGVFSQSYLTLAAPSVWVGVIVGAAMIYGAIRLRRWRDEG